VGWGVWGWGWVWGGDCVFGDWLWVLEVVGGVWLEGVLGFWGVGGWGVGAFGVFGLGDGLFFCLGLAGRAHGDHFLSKAVKKIRIRIGSKAKLRNKGWVTVVGEQGLGAGEVVTCVG